MSANGDIARDFADRTRPRLLAAIDESADHHVLYHADVDGACAAAILIALIAKRTGEAPQASWIPTSGFHFSDFEEQFPPRAARYISVDINFSSRAGLIERIGRAYGTSFLAIDDHLLSGPGSAGFNAINPNIPPRREGPLDLASSLYCYLAAAEELGRLPDWLPAIGLYFDRQIHLYRDLFPWLPDQKQLDRIIRLVSATYLNDANDRRVDPGRRHFEAAIAEDADWCDFYASVTDDAALRAQSEANEQEIARVSAGIDRDMEIVGHWRGEEIHFFAFSSPMQMANVAAARMRGRKPHGIFVSFREKAPISQLEVRLGHEVEGLDVVEMIGAIDRAIGLVNFGGHPRAAGGGVEAAKKKAFIAALQALN